MTQQLVFGVANPSAYRRPEPSYEEMGERFRRSHYGECVDCGHEEDEHRGVTGCIGDYALCTCWTFNDNPEAFA